MVDVSIVIPTYNRQDILCDTVRLVMQQDYPSCETIVVDQTPTVDPRVEEYLATVRGRVQYMRLPSPNLPAARNAGVLAARGKVIVFLDDDVQISQDYVTRHVRHYEDPTVGGVMGALVRSFAESGETFVEQLRTDQAGCWPTFEIERDGREGVAIVNWAIGCNTSYRREALIRAGLCDERYAGTAWCEDADLSMRVRSTGFRLLLDPAIKIVHLQLPSGGCNNRDVDRRAAIFQEQLELYLYFLFKNRKIVGYRELWRGLGVTYRRSALNRSTLKRGLSEFWRTHVAYGRLLGKSWRAVADLDCSSARARLIR